MLVKLELDNHDTLTFDAATEREAIDYASDICKEFESGGVMIIDGQDIGEFIFGVVELYYTDLTTREIHRIV